MVPTKQETRQLTTYNTRMFFVTCLPADRKGVVDWERLFDLNATMKVLAATPTAYIPYIHIIHSVARVRPM